MRPATSSPAPEPALRVQSARTVRADALLGTGALVPLIAAVAVVLLLGDAPYAALSRSDPGTSTAMTSAVLRAIVTAASTWCVGNLVYAVVLRQRTGRDWMRIDYRDSRPIVRSALVWCAGAVALVFVDAADTNGQSLGRLLQPGAVAYLASASYLPSAWIVVASLTALIAAVAFFGNSWQAHAAICAAALLALLPPVLVTQVLVGPNHDFGSDGAIIGVPAATVLVGLLAVARARLTRGPLPGAVTLRRLWIVLAIAWTTAIAGEIVVATFELVGTPMLLTPTAWLFLARLALLALLLPPVVRGLRATRLDFDLALQRTRAAGAMRPAVGLGALLVAAGVVMTRIPPPQYFVPTSIEQLFFGYDLHGPPTAAALALDWRANLLFLTAGVAASAAYLTAVVVLRRREDAWPAGRTAAWLLGWTVIVVTTSSGLGRYSSAVFSLHMVLHMALNMLGPLLLVLAGPITLALRALPTHRRTEAAGPREWVAAMIAWTPTHALLNPLLVFVRFIGAYYVLYFTPLFEQALRYHWAHQLMNIEFILVGVAFYGLVIGVDAPPRPVPHVGKLGMVLAAMPFHAFFGVAVMTSRTVIAGDFYRWVGAPWMGDLLADQAVGGRIAWAAGEIPLVIVIVALVTQWARQDARVAKRLDRHLDQGTDTSFDAYNAMLQRLGHADPGVPPRAARPEPTPHRDLSG